MFGFLRNWKAPQQSPNRLNDNRSRLRLETLEAREVPAAFRTVTALGDVFDRTNDATSLTLREALEDANASNQAGPLEIDFDPVKLDGKTIVIDSKLPRFLKHIELNGPANRVTIQRNATKGDFRLMEIAPTVPVKLTNLRLYDGRAIGANESGGAVLNYGNLTVKNCEVAGNEASANGGGISSANGSVIDVSDSAINFNKAGGDGGGLFVSYNVQATVKNTLISLNEAEYGAGIAVGTADMQTASLTLSGVDVRGNLAAKKGGGIYVAPIPLATPIITLKDNTFIRDNRVLDNVTAQGGGVYLGTGTINLNGVSIGDNHALAGDGMYRKQGTTKNVNQMAPVYVAGDQEVVG